MSITASTCYRSAAQPMPFWRAHLLPVILGCALLTLFSKIIIPLEPVPVSLQTVAVMLIGLLYSRRHAIESLTCYLVLGALGLPVFATGFGLPYLLGPTGGYLLGFLAAVMVMTYARDKWLPKRTLLHYTLLCLLGTWIIYAFGVSWLTYLMGLDKAIALGILPFILPALIKVGILSSVLKLLHTLSSASQ